MPFMSTEQYAWVQGALIDLSAAVNNGFGTLERRLDRVEVRLEQVELRLDTLERRVVNLEIRVDEGFEKIEARFVALERPKRKR
jgi:hypothetical protein